MTIVQRFKTGLDYGLNSFGLLWKQPQLLVYLSAPILVGITLALIVYNLFFFSDTNTTLFVDGIMLQIWSTFGWTRHIGIFVTDTIGLFVTIFASTALMQHVDHIMRGEKTSVMHCINKVAPKWKQILFWSLIATIFFGLIHPLDKIVSSSTCTSCSRLAFFVSAVARITWSLLTAFVVVCVALENLTLRSTLMLAPTITKNIFFEYLGAICWIGLMIILGVTPLLLFKFSSPVRQTLACIIIALGSCILSTVYAIAQVTLYRAHKNSALWEKIMTFPPL